VQNEINKEVTSERGDVQTGASWQRYNERAAIKMCKFVN